jgi:hypothetical protein
MLLMTPQYAVAFAAAFAIVVALPANALTPKEKRALDVEMICERQFNKTVQEMEAYCSSLPSSKYEFCTSQAWKLARESRRKCYDKGGVQPPNDGLD